MIRKDLADTIVQLKREKDGLAAVNLATAIIGEPVSNDDSSSPALQSVATVGATASFSVPARNEDASSMALLHRNALVGGHFMILNILL